MEPAPRVVVRGEATLRVPPDHASITVAATGRDRHRDRALAQLRERHQLVTSLLARFADLVTEYSTESVSVHPVVEGRKGITGYAATVSTRIRMDDVGRAGEVVAAAAALEGCELWGPSWQLDRDSPAHADARAAAIAEAVTRARGYAAAVGSTLTGLVELRDVGTGGSGPVFMAASATMRSVTAPAEPELDVVPAQQEVHGAVEAVFTLSPPDLEAI